MIKTIKATSRASIKIRDSFYTFEYCEEHSVNKKDVDHIEEVRAELWDIVNAEVDNQIEEVVEMLKEK